MSGFEVIVRPVVLPNIRPAKPQLIPAADDPSQGIAVLSGLGGKLIDLTLSEQSSWSRSRATETKRTFDEVRIYHVDDDGTVDREQFIDTEVVKKIQTRDSNGIDEEIRYADPPVQENIEIMKTDVVRVNKINQVPLP